VIAAAGNDGTTNPEYPASLNHVVSVSATSIADELTSYSTHGVNVDIAAPGGDNETDLNNDTIADGVVSTVLAIKVGSSELLTEYVPMDGTSMAAPHVAGIAGLMKSVNADMGPADFHTAYRSGEITVDLAQNGPTTRDDKFGYGRIDALKAVQWAVAANGGQQPSAFMTSSASSLDFGSDQQTIDLIIGKSGSGNLAVTGVGWSEPWMTVAGVGLDASGFGTYRISIDRSGLTEGQYSGEFGIQADDGSTLITSILMRVGQNVSGEAGYVYTLLLDQWTGQNVKMDQGPQVGSQFNIDLKDMPPGTYFVMVSTDLDNDNIVCDEGELCEFYPNNSEVEGVVISNSDVALGNFRMGFPTPDLKSSGQSSSSVVNSLSADKNTNSAVAGQGKVTAERPRN
jgi:serine protease